MAFQFYVKNTQGYNLYASSSSIMDTAVSDSGTGLIKVYSNNSTWAKIRYLTNPVTKRRFLNSIAIEILWSNGARQEVILGVSGGLIREIKWVYGTTTLGTGASYVNINNGGTVSVTASIDGNATPSHGKISYLSLYGYYVSKKGYGYNGDGVSDPNPQVGSWDKPGKAYPRESDAGANPPFSNKPYKKDFAFNPPTKNPNYYIMIAYKGYMQGIGHIDIFEGDSTEFQDTSSYGSGASGSWSAWGRYLRYSFYAVYDDGVVPGIKEDAAKVVRMVNNQLHSEADYNAMWVKFDTPETLYDLSWIKWPASPVVYLKDGSDRELKLKSAKNVKVRVPAWQVNPANYNSDYEFKEWHKKVGGNGWTGGLTDADVNNTKVTDTLTFALEMKIKTYTIKYNDTATHQTTYPNVQTGVTIRIDPFGNLPSGQTARHKNPITGTVGSYTNNNGYPIIVTQDFTIDNPTATGYTFTGWTLSNNLFKANWIPNTVTVVYKPGEGSGTQKTKEAEYNKQYTLLRYDSNEINFTPPAGKRFVGWTGSNGKSYSDGVRIPASDMKSNITLTAKWGSYWRKVKTIWIYDGSVWKRYLPWVNTR